jgi:hypothetical protein
MNFKKVIIGGCLIGASFFVSCQNSTSEAAQTEPSSEQLIEGEKDLDMQETSELALLMRDMYDKNLALKKQIKNGEIPESFPEDFLTIHTAKATEELNETFDALAKEYIANMQAITQAKNKEEGIIAYNNMIGTCASCHSIYCQGPLAKIKRMKIKAPGGKS